MASLHRSKGGLGLGLVLVKGLTEMHGGTVTVHSNGIGKGATFTVRLPLSNESAASQEYQDVPDIPNPRRRVLVVEDIKDVAFSIKALLESEGHEVRLAYNGIESIAIAKEFRPEVLLCDIGLPGMDGYQVAKTFRADKELNDVLLISLTGYARPNDLQRAKDAGFQVQIAKPVDLSTLRKALALVK